MTGAGRGGRGGALRGRRPAAAPAVASVAALVAAPVVAVVIAACGGAPAGAPGGAGAGGRARLVRCRAAPPLPSLGAEAAVFGALIGEGGLGLSGASLSGVGTLSGVGVIGELRMNAAAGSGGAASPARSGAAAAVGEPAVTGALAAAAITQVMRPRVAALAACVARAPQLLEAGATKTAATVEWRFTIGAGGQVIQADPAAHVLSAPIEACVAGVVRGAAFPAPPGGRVVAVALPIALDATGAAPAEPELEPPPAWTPFALDAAEAATATEQAARAAQGAVRGRLAAIDACFAGAATTGSLRAMLALDADGALISARAGGLGDRVSEACVENALAGLRVVLPSETSGEIACDLSRGDAQPWRVTLDRGAYGLVEIARDRVRSGGQELGAREALGDVEALAGHAVFALVADADAPGALLAAAMRWTADADATLVAVRPAGAGPAAAPQLLGMGRTAAAEDPSGEGDATRAMLEVGGGALTACRGRWRRVARLADPAAIDGAAQQLAARCRARACSSSLVIAADRDALARDLALAAGAARRAGFERLLLVPGAGGPPRRGDGGAADGATDGATDGASCTPPLPGDGDDGGAD